jgi:hypothetical protein
MISLYPVRSLICSQKNAFKNKKLFENFTFTYNNQELEDSKEMKDRVAQAFNKLVKVKGTQVVIKIFHFENPKEGNQNCCCAF